jgi:hypothetical protein
VPKAKQPHSIATRVPPPFYPPNPKARPKPLPVPQPAPSNAGKPLAATIDRLRSIATASTGAMVTEGPVNPDRILLAACADALAHCREAETLRAQRKEYFVRMCDGKLTDEDTRQEDGRLERIKATERAASGKLFGIRRLPAQTPAGIYSKALVVKSSKTGAADLARSLAEDLIANDVLRRLLWSGVGVTP